MIYIIFLFNTIIDGDKQFINLIEYKPVGKQFVEDVKLPKHVLLNF